MALSGSLPHGLSFSGRQALVYSQGGGEERGKEQRERKRNKEREEGRQEGDNSMQGLLMPKHETDT